MIGQLVRRLRDEKRLSQEELAGRAHLSVSFISKLERGLFKQPSPAALQKLAAALEAPLELLYREAGLEHLIAQHVSELEVDPTYELYMHQVSDLPRHDRDIIAAVLQDLIAEERAYEGRMAERGEAGE